MSADLDWTSIGFRFPYLFTHQIPPMPEVWCSLQLFAVEVMTSHHNTKSSFNSNSILVEISSAFIIGLCVWCHAPSYLTLHSCLTQLWYTCVVQSYTHPEFHCSQGALAVSLKCHFVNVLAAVEAWRRRINIHNPSKTRDDSFVLCCTWLLRCEMTKWGMAAVFKARSLMPLSCLYEVV